MSAESGITNTSVTTSPSLGAYILGSARAGRSTGLVEEMEAQGQQEFVRSDRVPADVRPRDQFEALGFIFGDPDPDDPIFMSAILPAGWSRRATDHAMWSADHRPVRPGTSRSLLQGRVLRPVGVHAAGKPGDLHH